MMNFCNVFSSLHETINGGNIFELASEFGQAHYEEQIDDVSVVMERLGSIPNDEL